MQRHGIVAGMGQLRVGQASRPVLNTVASSNLSRHTCCSGDPVCMLQMYGWQWGMFAPGIVGTVMGLLILLGVRDSPESSECAPAPASCLRSSPLRLLHARPPPRAAPRAAPAPPPVGYPPI